MVTLGRRLGDAIAEIGAALAVLAVLSAFVTGAIVRAARRDRGAARRRASDRERDRRAARMPELEALLGVRAPEPPADPDPALPWQEEET